MATPVGHALVGLLLARRMGVESPAGLGAAVVMAGLPDVDVIAGTVLHRDPWRLHRQGSHTFSFALAAGMLGGIGGAVRAGTAEGERDLVADGVRGAVLVGSHIVLDKMPLPYIGLRKGEGIRRLVLRSVWNLALDTAAYGTLAARYWPRAGATPS